LENDEISPRDSTYLHIRGSMLSVFQECVSEWWESMSQKYPVPCELGIERSRIMRKTKTAIYRIPKARVNAQKELEPLVRKKYTNCSKRPVLGSQSNCM
jgi:hypothetical protein